MSKNLITNGDWASIHGQPCKVVRFTPLAKVEGNKVVYKPRSAPYALVALECPKLPPDTVGGITHQLDFKNLWAAFVERGVSSEEEVIIFWIKKHLKGFAKLLSPFMPGLSVMVFKAGAYELMTDPHSQPELVGLERHIAELPIMSWGADV